MNPIPELSSYLKASITPEMYEILESNYPVTHKIKEKKLAKSQGRGIS